MNPSIMWRSVIRMERRAELLVMVLAWGASVGFVLWQATVAPQLIWQDSEAYVAVAAHPLWSMAFWAGTYPPVVPILWKVTGSGTAFVLVQGLLAVGAWGFLAWTVSRLLGAPLRRSAAFVVVLAFSTVTQVVLWNRSVLSESVSLSLIATLYACIILLSRSPSWPKVIAVVATAMAMASVRDSLIWTVGALSVFCGIYAVVVAKKDPGVGIFAAVLAVSLVMVAGLASWGVQYSKREVVSVVSVLEVRVFPYPQRVAWFASHGMPEATAVDRLAQRTKPSRPSQTKVVSISESDPAFGKLVVWEQEAGPSTYARWIVSHPTYLLTEPLVRPQRSLNNANGSVMVYAAANRVDSPFSSVLWPSWWWLLPMALVALASSVISGVWRSRTWGIVVVLTMIGVVEIIVSWNADGQEAARHTIEGVLEVRLGALLLFLIGVFSIREHLAGAAGRLTSPTRRLDPSGGGEEVRE